MNANRFEGRVAVVTGGSSGLGYGTAERLIAEGATVYIVGRRQEELDKAAQLLGPAAIAVRADVTNNDDLDRLYAAVAEAGAGLHVVVANAGGPSFGTIDSYTGAELDTSYTLNLRAAAFTVQKALPLMAEGGSIVIMSSIEGERGSAGLGAYASMKAAQQSMARTWANELRERRIRVNAISPGVVYTPAYETAGWTRDQAAEVVSLIPVGRLGLASEVGAAVAFLASDDASFVNGTNLVVDGGQTEIV
jgi:NAD(P)-dependent dehydrogenase (short-subunit alcohol dehydrogenase family)